MSTGLKNNKIEGDSFPEPGQLKRYATARHHFSITGVITMRPVILFGLLSTLLFASFHASANRSPDDPGDGGGGGGGTPAPPFAPPYMAPPQTMLPSDFPAISNYPNTGGGYQVCEQFPHVFTAFSNDITRGTPLYLSGIVAASTFAVFGFYNEQGQLIKSQHTNDSKSNCVIHHDENEFSTGDLAPGYYSVYASYIGLGAPNALQCQFGTPPPDFNYYVTTSGFECPMPMQRITTIRIR